MRRRSLLATIAGVGTVAAAGCAGLRGPIQNRTFDICDTDCDWQDRTPDPGADPVVERQPDEQRVVVYGNMYVGSSSCDRAVLDSLSVADDTLHAVVGVGDKQGLPGTACTADMGTDQYRLRVQFREAVPEQVTVEEHAAWDPEPSESSETATGREN